MEVVKRSGWRLLYSKVRACVAYSDERGVYETSRADLCRSTAAPQHRRIRSAAERVSVARKDVHACSPPGGRLSVPRGAH